MTIIGIGGCMGLLLVGFGLRDSIMDVAILQYQDIQVYDGMIVLDADADQSGQDELKQELADDGSHDDLLRKTEYYLNHEDERAQIARNGHEKAVKFHSYEKRMEFILDKCGMLKH